MIAESTTSKLLVESGDKGECSLSTALRLLAEGVYMLAYGLSSPENSFSEIGSRWWNAVSILRVSIQVVQAHLLV